VIHRGTTVEDTKIIEDTKVKKKVSFSKDTKG
jgi:hypothetical protein